MKLDYDLSNLETSQADLWLFLQVNTICAQIQAKHPASTRSRQLPQAWPQHNEEHYRPAGGCSQTVSPGEFDLKALNEMVSELVPPVALIKPWPLMTSGVRAAFGWVN